MSVSIGRLGWRISFLLLAGIGFVWALGWYVWFRDQPAREEAEAAAGADSRSADTSGARPLLSANSAILLAQYFASNFTFFICFSWLLPYIRSRFGLPAEQAGIYASIPLYFGAVATWTSGWTVDWLYRSGRQNLSRRLPAIAGFALAGASLIAAASMPSPRSFILLFALTTFGVDFTLSPSWTACSDIAGARTGTLSGAMNAMGSLGSFASSICFPWLLGLTGDVQTYFFCAALLNLIAVGGWCLFDPKMLPTVPLKIRSAKTR